MSASIQDQYNNYRRTIESINQKIFQFEMDIDQHNKVLEVLKETDPHRHCKHMINNVLVDLTVAEAIPRIQSMQAGIQKALDTLKIDLKTQEKSLEEWKVKNNVKVVS